jgi:hypothetical protein
MPIMGKRLEITLDSVDLGQLLEGLRARAESWQKTADLLESGYISDDSFICEECSDAGEAIQVAEHYRRIVVSVERQVEEQGGW